MKVQHHPQGYGPWYNMVKLSTKIWLGFRLNQLSMLPKQRRRRKPSYKACGWGLPNSEQYVSAVLIYRTPIWWTLAWTSHRMLHHIVSGRKYHHLVWKIIRHYFELIVLLDMQLFLFFARSHFLHCSLKHYLPRRGDNNFVHQHHWSVDKLQHPHKRHAHKMISQWNWLARFHNWWFHSIQGHCNPSLSWSWVSNGWKLFYGPEITELGPHYANDMWSIWYRLNPISATTFQNFRYVKIKIWDSQLWEVNANYTEALKFFKPSSGTDIWILNSHNLSNWML